MKKFRHGQMDQCAQLYTGDTGGASTFQKFGAVNAVGCLRVKEKLYK